jgi:hypothetical protein
MCDKYTIAVSNTLNARNRTMSATELKTLSKIIKMGWKQLALADQDDADEMLKILKETLESLEELEAE